MDCLGFLTGLHIEACDKLLSYEQTSATEGFIDSIKSRLKKICASLYKKAQGVYERNKTKHPKIAALFKRFADFFKRCAGVVDKTQTQEETAKVSQEIKDSAEQMKKAEKLSLLIKSLNSHKKMLEMLVFLKIRYYTIKMKWMNTLRGNLQMLKDPNLSMRKLIEWTNFSKNKTKL